MKKSERKKSYFQGKTWKFPPCVTLRLRSWYRSLRYTHSFHKTFFQMAIRVAQEHQSLPHQPHQDIFIPPLTLPKENTSSLSFSRNRWHRQHRRWLWMSLQCWWKWWSWLHPQGVLRTLPAALHWIKMNEVGAPHIWKKTEAHSVF